MAENVGYGWEYGPATMLRRSVSTSLGHMILASIWGFRWALACYEERRRNGRIDLRPTAAAVGLAALDHGFYNLMLSIDGSLSIRHGRAARRCRVGTGAGEAWWR